MKFIKEVLYCFYPPKYKQLKNKGFWKSYSLLLKVLFLAFIIAAMLSIPKLAALKADIINDLDKINIINISGKVSTTAPVNIPQKNPLFTIDLQSDSNMKNELFLINKREFQFRFFGKRKIDLPKLKDPAAHKQEVGTFITSMILLLAPGFAFITFVKAAIKYLIISLLISFLAFFIMDLTDYKTRFKNTLTITTHAGIPLVLIETLVAVTNPKILFPFMRFIGLRVYAITLVIWFIYTLLCIISVKAKVNKSDG
ncbi:hypothetical protein DRJ25_00440 [Candidatus Woesearchaeota archaeon]|nr:MAG: hypothetical protein DRJ25_00440 [Candidatus Woesearchaeota archaeon]